MNTLKDTNPPTTEPAPQGAGEDNPVVAVRLSIPENAVTAPIFPSSNRWATMILSRLLRNRMEAAGIAVTNSYPAFPFNSSLYLFDLAQKPAGPALAVIRGEMEALGLLDHAQIAWRDHDELVWRLYYPKSGVFKAPSKEESEANSRLLMEAEEALKHGKKVYGDARN